jgi:hypothetical protein
MLSLPYIFVLISVIDSLQVRLLYGLGALSHSRCSPMMLSYILTGVVPVPDAATFGRCGRDT